MALLLDFCRPRLDVENKTITVFKLFFSLLLKMLTYLDCFPATEKGNTEHLHQLNNHIHDIFSLNLHLNISEDNKPHFPKGAESGSFIYICVNMLYRCYMSLNILQDFRSTKESQDSRV